MMTKHLLLGVTAFLVAFLLHQETYAAKQGEAVLTLIESNLDQWDRRGNWTIGHAKIDPHHPDKLIASTPASPLQLINSSAGGDIYTKELFGDCTLELEVMIPEESNSGIYMMGQYEVQVKDSYGKSWWINSKDMGGIVDRSKPKMNAAKKAGEWQKYLIVFKAPRFEGAERVAPAEFVKVVLNGKIVQENIKMEEGPTPGALTERELSKGPLLLQGSLGSVAYRNIKITIPK